MGALSVCTRGPPGRFTMPPAALGQWLEAPFPSSGFKLKTSLEGRWGLSRRPEVHRAMWLVSAYPLHGCAPGAPKSSACDLFGSRGCVQMQLNQD